MQPIVLKMPASRLARAQMKGTLLKGIMTKQVENEDYKTLSHVGQSFVNIF
jgi:hypothetical protein